MARKHGVKLDQAESIPGNNWTEQVSRSTFWNWLSGWIDPRQANHSDNTNILLLIIDDGYFAIDMGTDQIANFPASYHGGAGGVTFADGHAEIHRWRSVEVQARQQSGAQGSKFEFKPVARDNPDLLWLRDRATSRIE